MSDLPSSPPDTRKRRPLRWSISTKIFVAFGAIILAFSAVGLFGLFNLKELRSNMGFVRRGIRVTTELNVAIRELGQFEAEWGGRDLRALRPDFLVYYNPYEQIRTAERIAKRVDRALAGSLNQLRVRNRLPSRVDEELKVFLTAARARYPDAEGDELRFHALARAIKADLDRLEFYKAHMHGDLLVRFLGDVQADVIRLRDAYDAHVTRVDGEAQESERRGSLLVGAVAAIALLLALAFGLWAGLTVRPLSRLREGAQRVARGDFATVDVRTGDEIGQLAEEFNVMAASLAHRDHLLKRQGEELMRNERLATIGQMSSQITHEIRNPLASMGLNTELLEDELTDLVSRLGDTDQLDEVRQLVNAIRGEVDRLTDVTDQYLRFARLSAPTREPTDLNGLIRSLLDFSSAELSQRRVTVTTNLSETLGEVSLDADQIRQCVLNLVRNAMEAMPDGGKLTVTTRRDEENHAQLTIADTGEGMDDTTIARIYEPFFSTKTTGTGLGLPLVQEIIREHEGELLVESRTGAGTTFTVRLPG